MVVCVCQRTGRVSVSSRSICHPLAAAASLGPCRAAPPKSASLDSVPNVMKELWAGTMVGGTTIQDTTPTNFLVFASSVAKIVTSYKLVGVVGVGVAAGGLM